MGGIFTMLWCADTTLMCVFEHGSDCAAGGVGAAGVGEHKIYGMLMGENSVRV